MRESIEKKLCHLRAKDADGNRDTLLNSGSVTRTLYDKGPENTPMRHFFELEDDEPIFRGRSLPPKHNRVVREEIDKILRASIITSASSAWSFPVVIATKRDGNPRFLVDYRRFNQKMKDDRWPIPKEQEILYNMSGVKVFSMVELFSGYWKVRLSESCKMKTTFMCQFGT